MALLPTGDRGSVGLAVIAETMGKLQEFEISFDKSKVVYSPGDSISGSVKIQLNSPLQCKGENTPVHLNNALNKEVRYLVELTWSSIQPFHADIFDYCS